MAEIERRPSRPVSEDEKHLLDIERNSVAHGIAKIEETAKLLVGSVSAVTGIFVAATKVADPGLRPSVWPLLLWCLAIMVCLLVVMPLPHRHGQHVPESIRTTLRRTMWLKWALLVTAVVLFSVGTVAAVIM